MCIICQTISLGAALVTGALPVAVPETQTAQSSAPPPAIAGATCKTVGQQRTSGGVRFTCTATKTKRVWRRTSSATATTTAVTTTTTTIPRGYLKPNCGPGVADCPAHWAARMANSLQPPPAGIRPTPASTRPT